MINKFAYYLNSLNNANSSNKNSLAESQITNTYYQKIHVSRKLGHFLGKKLSKEPTCVILTGHAGDGKTSLLYQILRDNKLFDENESFREYDQRYSVEFGRKLFYIKDMSELTSNQQVQLLKKALTQPQEQNSSIVVTNTGPLLESFKNLVKQIGLCEEDIEKVEMDLLNAMDNLNETIHEIVGFRFMIINMARLDNIPLVPKLLDNLTQETLWKSCENCEAARKCPIYNNYLAVKANYDHVSRFTQSYFRWLYEIDHRLTVRQILAHISYSITGNLTCEDVKRRNNLLFKYHFANLFFGNLGVDQAPDAKQIRGIRELQSLNLDSKKMKVDYQVFVNEDFTQFHPIVQDVIKSYWNKESRRLRLSDRNLAIDTDAKKLRGSLRRFYMLFGIHTEETFAKMIDDTYSPIFSSFIKFRSQKLSQHELNITKNMITKALYFIFIGSQSAEDVETIYLPLQREGYGLQSVQLILGLFSREDIELRQKVYKSKLEEEESYYTLNIKFEKLEQMYPVSLLLLDYFYKVSKGAVSTKLNPALSHGIDKMKADLMEGYKFRNKNDIRLLVHTVHGVEKVRLQVDDEEGKIIMF